jgi:hypothetical protein
MRTCVCACSLMLNLIVALCLLYLIAAIVSVAEPLSECATMSAMCSAQCIEQAYSRVADAPLLKALKNGATATLLVLCETKAAGAAASAITSVLDFVVGSPAATQKQQAAPC